MSVLEVEHIAKSFEGVHVIEDVSFGVDQGEILVIVGGSGSGKTTTLRCIAGLEDISAGTIRLDGRVLAEEGRSVPPEKRQMGMVFQSYALWPHKTVYQNVSYGLERKGLSGSAIRGKVDDALARLGIRDLAGRFPHSLSGGQQQRVSFARAAVVGPRLLLLDEPLSNLDAKLRERMRDELRDMIKSLAMTAIHITHDQSEAMALADRIAYLKAGRIEQIGPPQDLFRRPRTLNVAEFIGASSFLQGRPVPGSSSAEGVDVDLGSGVMLRVGASPEILSRAAVTIGLRTDAIELLDAPGERSLQAKVLKATFLGSQTEYAVDLGPAQIRAQDRVDRAVGSTCYVDVDPRKIVCFDEGGLAIPGTAELSSSAAPR